MNFDHPKWKEFISELGDETLLNGCSSEKDKSNTRKVLERIGDIDIEKTIEFLESEDGSCDCGIMYNVISPNE